MDPFGTIGSKSYTDPWAIRNKLKLANNAIMFQAWFEIEYNS